MSEWIEWSGGECPVPPDTVVQAKFVSGYWGTTGAEGAARKFSWASPSPNVYGDIVAYRVVSEEPKAETGVWIAWSGGDRPVDGSTMVEVRFAGGGENVGWADQFSQDQWRGRGKHQHDIVGYRVISQKPKAETGVWIDPTKTTIREIRLDLVNSPPHYTDGGIEAIDYIAAKLGPDGFRSYCVGNALKYISRAGKKGSTKEDLSKAIWYLRRAGGE